jgi:hypothetical protein
MFTRNIYMATCFAVLVVVPALAQTQNARLDGTVQDPTGAVIPGASLTLTNVKTQVKAQTTSGAEGSYVFTAVKPGIYTLETDSTGFRKSVIEAIELNVGGTVSVIVRLEVGAATESVVVEASTVSVQTTESQLSRAVNMRDIDTLPQLARTPITLAVFQPGVQINPSDSSYSRVNGGRIGSNNTRLDGIDVNDSVVPRLGLAMNANNVDSIGEFRIVLGAGKAEYGRSAGGQVELITRSGSNNFHGNAFDYLRNTQLNANDFFSNQSKVLRPKFIQNIFGGSFGGRIRRDKTFFFGNFQGRRLRQETVRNRTVYTPQAKQGIFRWAAGGATQSFNFAANGPNADPRGKGVDAAVAKINAQMPDPNNFDVGDGLNTAGFRFNTPSNSFEDQMTYKVDHNFTSNNRAFVRVSWQRNSSIDTLNSAERTYPGQVDGTQGGRRWGFSIGDDWSIKPTLINEFRIGYAKASTDFLRPNRPKGPAYITTLVSDVQYSPFPQGRWSPVTDITENLTWLKGKHVFKMGTSIRHTLQYGYNESGIYPNVTTAVANGNIVAAAIGPQGLTATQRTQFERLYNDILGRIDLVTMTFYSDLQKFQPAGAPRVRNYNLNEGGVFFQDDWKVSRNLTFNAGVRYELFLVPNERDGFQGAIDKKELVNGINTATDLTIQRSSDWFQTDRNNFAPRIGFAYDLKGDGRTAIRGGYGIFYDRAMGTIVNSVDGATPGFSQSVPVFPNQTNNDIRFADTYPLPSAPSAPVLTLPTTRSTTVYVMSPKLRSGYSQNFSLNIQHEVIRNTVVDVGFVGSRGVKLFYWRDVNQPRITPEFITSFKEMQAYAANSSSPVSSGNVFARIFGTPAAALTNVGATGFTQGLVGTVINGIDRSGTNQARMTAAGLPVTYFRPYPQFNLAPLGTNDGRSAYNSLQVSVRRNTGALRTTLNYTWSHSFDNVAGYSATSSAAEGNSFTQPIDNFNLGLMRATSDFDHRHTFNSSISYTLPVGKGKRFGANMGRLLDAMIGGWDVGALTIWQTGTPYTVFSQRVTGPQSAVNTWANYTGPKGIGAMDRRGDGVYYLPAGTMSSFGYPGAFEVGTSGRNLLTGPRFFNTDMSLVKSFKITEGHSVKFRAEAYNLFNNPNFGGMATNLLTPTTFGKFSSTIGATGTNARVLQMSLRYDF